MSSHITAFNICRYSHNKFSTCVFIFYLRLNNSNFQTNNQPLIISLIRIIAQLKTLTLAVIFTTSLALNVQAQTKNDVAIAFNAAVQLANTDIPGAIKAMTDVIGMCDKVGADANDLKANAQKAIPAWHFQIANNFLKDKKFDEAQVSLEKSLELAELYNDADTKDKVSKQLSKVYVVKGNSLLKAGKVDEALVLFDKSIVLQPTYAKAYFVGSQQQY